MAENPGSAAQESPQPATQEETGQEGKTSGSTQPTVTAIKLTPQQWGALCNTTGLDPQATTVPQFFEHTRATLSAASEAKEEMARLETQVRDSRREADTLRDELGTIKAQTIVSKAISQGKLLGWQRDSWVEMAKTNPQEVEASLRKMPVKVSLHEKGYASMAHADGKRSEWF